MSNKPSNSDLVEVVKRNGDFRRNYGTLIGGFLYLRSISAARGQSFFWNAVLATATAALTAWLQKYGWRLPV
jgi:hypothetical protein